MDKIRNFMQSWPGKLVLVGTLIPMAFLGVQGMQGGAAIAAGELIKIGKQAVTVSDFQSEVNQYRNQLLQRGVDASMINEAALENEILKRVVDRTLLQHQGVSFGMTVSDEAITQMIAQDPAFMENGEFSNEKFANFLQQSQMSKDMLFASLRMQLTLRQLLGGVLGSAIYPNAQISRLLDLQLEEREVWVHRYAWQDYVDQVDVSDADVAAYFEANKDKLIKPATVDLTYIVLDPETIKTDAPSEEEVRAQYADYLKDKGISDSRELAQILLTGNDAQSKADVVYAKLQKGEAFETLAKSHSDDPSGENGGNIGAFNAAVFGSDAPAVEAALSGLSAGQYTKPIKTSFGYQIFKITKVTGNAPKIESIKDELIERAARYKRQASFADLSAKISTMASDGVGVADIAKEAHLELQTLPNYPQTNNQTQLNQPAVIAAAFDDFTIQDQGVSPMISMGEKSVWLQPTNYQAARPLTFEEAKDDIKQLLAKQKASELAYAAAQKAAEAAKAGGVKSLMNPSAHFGVVTRTNNKLGSAEAASLFVYQSDAAQDVWAVQTDDGASVIVGGKVQKISETQLPADARATAVRVIRDNIGESELEDYLRYLRDNTEIVINQDALQHQEK